MGKLMDRIEGLGYGVIEGRPLRTVPVGDEAREIRELRVRAGDGQEIVIRCDTSPQLFPAAIAGGDAALDVHTSSDAVYRDYYGLDDEACAWLLHNCSHRTRSYLDAERARLGLLDYKEGAPIGFFALGRYAVRLGFGEVDVGRYADGRFVAQTSHANFDEAHVLRMHFTRFPTQQDVEDSLAIRKLERDFRLGRHREAFICEGCGQVRHWLDIEGTVREKLRMRLRRQCGCCAQ